MKHLNPQGGSYEVLLVARSFCIVVVFYIGKLREVGIIVYLL
jgi:hypothetical protein